MPQVTPGPPRVFYPFYFLFEICYVHTLFSDYGLLPFKVNAVALCQWVCGENLSRGHSGGTGDTLPPDEYLDPSASAWKSSIFQDAPVTGTPSSVGSYNTTLDIKLSERRQTIDGFGGSNAWFGLPENAAAVDEVVRLLFSTTEGAGLSILRTHIPWDDDGKFLNYSNDTLNWNYQELQDTKTLIGKIRALNNGPSETEFKIMSTPWTPPKKWKSNNSISGGSLNTANYTAYADLMADYAKNFRANMGFPLTVLSVQNESGTTTGYESCLWTADNIKEYLTVIGQRFKANNVQTNLGIMAAEDEDFTENLVKNALTNASAKPVLTHVGIHQYGGLWDSSSSKRYHAEKSKVQDSFNAGKRIWQTEMSNYSNNTAQSARRGRDIENALEFAIMIHRDLCDAEINAYLYWWLFWDENATHSNDLNGNTNTTDNMDEALIHNNGATVTTPKRLWGVANFSRFVRPGWYRVHSSTQLVNGSSEVFGSAYRSNSGEIAIVLINDSGSDKTITVNPSGGTVTVDKAYRTSASENLAEIGVPALSSVTLKAKSITTLVGRVQ
jgi:glucuronoarabinoxylan endo-1,4-beta-xylanase